MLAFRMTNVVFSLVVGAAPLSVGGYGRLTGSLPAGSPYARAAAGPARAPAPTEGVVERAMAAAERAVALRAATDEQLAGVRAAAPYRTHEDRRRAFSTAL